MANKPTDRFNTDRSPSIKSETSDSTPERLNLFDEVCVDDSIVSIPQSSTSASVDAKGSGTLMELEWCLNQLSVHIQTLDDHYRNSVPIVQRYTSDNADLLWSTLCEFPLSRLAAQERSLSEEANEDGLAIRRLYPELDLLPLAHLHFWYTEYQAKCRYRDPPQCARSLGFLFFLLGQLASQRTRQNGSPLEAGVFVALAFLKGMNAEQSLHFGTTCLEFRMSLRMLATSASSIHLRILSAVDYRAS